MPFLLRPSCAALAVCFAATTSLPSLAQPTGQRSGCSNNAAAAIVGGLLGALSNKKHRTEGAVIGAALATIACLVIDASSQQTSSAEAALQDYQQRHEGQTPTEPLLDRYESKSADSVAKGSNAVVQSNGLLVVPPSMQPNARFAETFELSIPGEATPKRSRKDISVIGGGGFQQTFSFPVGSELPQGVYRYVTRIIGPDNRVLGEQSGQFQVI